MQDRRDASSSLAEVGQSSHAGAWASASGKHERAHERDRHCDSVGAAVLAGQGDAVGRAGKNAERRGTSRTAPRASVKTRDRAARRSS